MTETLKTLMHEQADSVDFAVPDLDAMVRTGDRRRRTRRLGAVGAVAATVTGVALVATTLAPGQRAVGPAGPAAPAVPLSWVDGSTLHEGDVAHDLDFRTRAFTRTAEGYVFSDRDGNVWSWVDGVSTRVGRTHYRHPHLVTDDETGLAGWVDLSEATDERTALEEAEYAVLDQSTGDVRTYPAPDRIAPGQFLAIDAGTAYWQGADSVVAADLDSGRTNPVDLDRGTIADVEDDLAAVRTDAGISVRTLAGQEVRPLDGFHGELGSFSPDARWFTNDADEPQVFDVAAGQRVGLDLDRGFATGYEWLGSGTLAVIASTEASDDSRVELMVCEVPAGSCEQVAELGTFAQVVDTLVLPTGTATDE